MRAPAQKPVRLPHEWFHHAPGPVFGPIAVRPEDADLTRQHQGEPLGQRIILSGRVTDSDGRAVTNTLVEVWQANAAGRYLDPVDDHPAPLDPILGSIPDPKGRELLISSFDMETTEPEWALGYRWDIVLRGRHATPAE